MFYCFVYFCCLFFTKFSQFELLLKLNHTSRRWDLRNNRSQRDKEYRKNLLAEIMTFEEHAVNCLFFLSMYFISFHPVLNSTHLIPTFIPFQYLLTCLCHRKSLLFSFLVVLVIILIYKYIILYILYIIYVMVPMFTGKKKELAVWNLFNDHYKMS